MSEASAVLVKRRFNLSHSEAAKIKEIEEECHLSNWLDTDYQDESNRDNSLVLIAEFQCLIIGFLIVRVEFQETDEFSRSSISNEADLLNFGVLKAFQRKGIGAKLFLGLLGELNHYSAGNLWLEVRESNEEAINFYLHRKFQIIQIRRNFYSNPVEDALLMKLEIGQGNHRKL